MKKNKNKIIKIIFNARFVALVGLIVIIAISIPLAKNISRKTEINREITNLQKEIKEIENKNTDLKKIIDYMGSDRYIEEQARLNFGLKKSGEEAVVVELNDGSETVVNKEAASHNDSKEDVFNIPGLKNYVPDKDVTNPKKWWSYFFDKL